MRIIWSTTSSQISTQRRMIHPSHGHLHPSQGYTSFHLKRHTHIMGILTPYRGTQRPISVSEMNVTPITWAHPTHGLSHRSSHSVSEENVSWRMSYEDVIINTPSQLGRHSPPGQVSHGSTRTSWKAVW
jgi:hypothetical protein